MEVLTGDAFHNDGGQTLVSSENIIATFPLISSFLSFSSSPVGSCQSFLLRFFALIVSFPLLGVDH